MTNRPEVLNIPPLNIVMGQETKLQNELKHKEQLIDHLKVEFEDKCREQFNKHIAKIEEYNKREERLKKLTRKKNELLEGKKIERITTIVKAKREKIRIDSEISKAKSVGVGIAKTYDQFA